MLLVNLVQLNQMKRKDLEFYNIWYYLNQMFIQIAVASSHLNHLRTEIYTCADEMVTNSIWIEIHSRVFEFTIEISHE